MPRTSSRRCCPQNSRPGPPHNRSTAFCAGSKSNPTHRGVGCAPMPSPRADPAELRDRTVVPRQNELKHAGLTNFNIRANTQPRPFLARGFGGRACRGRPARRTQKRHLVLAIPGALGGVLRGLARALKARNIAIVLAGLRDDVRENLTAVGAEQDLGPIPAHRTIEDCPHHACWIVESFSLQPNSSY